jgi:hypothetical protein
MDKALSGIRVIAEQPGATHGDGLIYSTDYNGGLYIIEFDPHGR